jgi:hypothetical protein
MKLERVVAARPRCAIDRCRFVAVVVCFLLTCGEVGQSVAQWGIPEADRNIKLGTRLPEVAPGEGGELRVIADRQWCRDASYILEVRLYTAHEAGPAVRLVAGPSECTWVFERMPAGEYDALIMTRREEEIVAVGRGRLSSGSITSITAESAQTELEGFVTSQQPLPSPLRLRFTTGSNPWRASVAADGSYRVRLGDIDARTRLSVWAEADGTAGSEPSPALDMFELTTTTISRGLTRMDFADVKLPPVVVHFEVPAVPDARFDEFAEAMLDHERGYGFKLLRGFRGQFLATYGEHIIEIWTNDRQHVLASKVFDVTPSETESRVVMPIPHR